VAGKHTARQMISDTNLGKEEGKTQKYGRTEGGKESRRDGRM